MPSLRTLAEAVQRHRMANPHLAKVHGWRMSLEEIELEMDFFNAQICFDHGWGDFITLDQGSAPPPKAGASLPRAPGRLGRLAAAGLNAIAKMFGNEGTVPKELANQRANVCVQCPQNSRGDWTRFFTKLASEQVRKMLEARKGMGLKTDYDEQLNICEVCACPLRLKVHAQLAHIKEHTDAETAALLPDNCWIRTEKS